MAMDAVEYLKVESKIIGSCTNCNVCLLQDCCNKEDDEQINKCVAIVEQWALNNPIKTYKSEFMKMFPNAELGSSGYPISNFRFLTSRIVERSFNDCWDAEFKGWS